MIGVGFTNPAPIPFNPSTNAVSITSGYQDIWTHTQTTQCTLNSCYLMEIGCADPLPAQTNVLLGSSPPYPITAV